MVLLLPLAMRNVGWLLALGILACSSSPRVVNDPFDSGRDLTGTGGVCGSDGGADGPSCLGHENGRRGASRCRTRR